MGFEIFGVADKKGGGHDGRQRFVGKIAPVIEMMRFS